MTDIRAAGAADIDGIAMIHLRNMRQMAEIAPRGLGKSLLTPPPIAQISSYFADCLADDDCLLLVAAGGDDIHGFLSAAVETHPDDLLDSPFLTIEFVEVESEAQGMGLATQLLQAAEEFARGRSIGSIDLSVWRGNTRARELYERLGYEAIEIRMLKRITNPQSTEL